MIKSKPPMTAAEVSAHIAEMERNTKSKAARIAMAKLAVARANCTNDARDIWRDYLTTLEASNA